MYKNQLQELAQRSCFNLPSYTCLREGPDHAPRFKATVKFNGEVFESPHYCSTLRQAEHSAAEAALLSLSNRRPSLSLASRILDETGVCKNLLQEIAQRVGAPLPQYTTFRSGLGHLPIFMGTVELAGIIFTGEAAKNKKQAEKNAAMSAWSSLRQLAKEAANSSSEPENNDEVEQVTIARALINYRKKEKIGMGNSANSPVPFAKKFAVQNTRPLGPQPPPATTSKILPFICSKVNSRNRSNSTAMVERPVQSPLTPGTEAHGYRPQKFSAVEAAPYVPMRRHLRPGCHHIAPPVTVRTAVPVFSALPSSLSSQPQPANFSQPQPASVFPSEPLASMMAPQQRPLPFHSPPMRAPSMRIAPPVTIRQAVPVFAAPPMRNIPVLPDKSTAQVEETMNETVQELEKLKI